MTTYRHIKHINKNWRIILEKHMTASILLKFKINICEVSDQPAYWKMRDQRDWVIRGEDWLFNVLIILRQLTMILTVLAMLPTVSTLHSTGLHRRTLSMNCVKWRTSRLVSDSVLPRLHHWSSAALDYPPSATEPFRLPLLASGTVYPSTSLLHLRCLSSRLIFLLFPIPVHDHVQCLQDSSLYYFLS